MSTLVTQDQVRKIILIENDPVGLDLAFHISTADFVVTDRLSQCGYSDERKEKIVLYLAAHFTSLFLREPEEQEMGDSRERYTSQLNPSYSSTRFGQMAISFDYKGVLAGDTSNKFSAELEVIV